jgi:site-specific DNA recombinase
MKTLAKAHAWRELLTTGKAASLRDLAKRSGCDESRVRHLLPLAFMAPDIVTMILCGKQPRHVTVDRVVRLGIPAAWPTQRELLGLTA